MLARAVIFFLVFVVTCTSLNELIRWNTLYPELVSDEGEDDDGEASDSDDHDEEEGEEREEEEEQEIDGGERALRSRVAASRSTAGHVAAVRGATQGASRQAIL